MFARFTKAGLALALVATALLSGVSSAEAAPVTVLSCYGSAKPINGTDPNGHWPPYGSTYTTANCNDINVKMTQDVDVQTCFAPSSGGGYYCNGWRRVYAITVPPAVVTYMKLPSSSLLADCSPHEGSGARTRFPGTVRNSAYF